MGPRDASRALARPWRRPSSARAAPIPRDSGRAPTRAASRGGLHAQPAPRATAVDGELARPAPRAGVADGGDEGENARERKTERGALTGGPRAKIVFFHPRLTAHGWEFGRNGTERINQNFYDTEGNLKNFIAYKEPI